jgi:hypothetical protein
MHPNALGVLQRVADHVDENPLQRPGREGETKIIGIDRCQRNGLFKTRQDIAYKR